MRICIKQTHLGKQGRTAAGEVVRLTNQMGTPIWGLRLRANSITRRGCIKIAPHLYTAVAHEVERWTYNPQVDGSIPSGSTNSPWTRRFCAMKSDWVGSPERSRSSPDCLIAGMRIIQKRGIFLRGNYVSANNMGQSHPALREDTSGDGDDFLEEPKGCKTPLPR